MPLILCYLFPTFFYIIEHWIYWKERSDELFKYKQILLVAVFYLLRLLDICLRLYVTECFEIANEIIRTVEIVYFKLFTKYKFENKNKVRTELKSKIINQIKRDNTFAKNKKSLKNKQQLQKLYRIIKTKQH